MNGYDETNNVNDFNDQNEPGSGEYYSYREPDRNGSGPSSPKRSGVGKVVAVTLGMLLLVGIAAAGGYSAHTLVEQLKNGWESVVGSSEPEETKASADNGSQKETETSLKERETIPQTTTMTNQPNRGAVILTDVSDMVASVMPSVVSIVNSSVYTSQNFGGFWQGATEIPTESSGSGIIIGQNESELFIVTNNHVVENNKSLTVQFMDGSSAEATVKASKASSDIAIISIPLDKLSQETKESIAIATLGNSDELRIGQGVIAIGNALGYGQSVTEGCVSALNRKVTTSEGTTLNVLQTSAAINPGNSGGALLNASGEVIGINTAKVMDTRVEGINYAIPISSVIDLISDMMQWESRNKVDSEDASYLGIQPVSVDDESSESYDMPRGVYVYSVTDNSPAERAGMRAKDIITAVDQYPVGSTADLQNALEYFSGGETVTIIVQRQVDGAYQELSLDVTLAYKRDYTTR